MPCLIDFDLYSVIFKAKIIEAVDQQGANSLQGLNLGVQIGIVAQTLAFIGKAAIEDMQSAVIEIKNKTEYKARAKFSLDKDNRVVFTNGRNKGDHLNDFDKHIKELTPNLYNPVDAAVNNMIDKAFQSGSTIVAVPYYREGKDNRDIVIMKLDKKTNKGEMFVVNTAPNGDFHSFDKIKDIARSRFTDLNGIAPTDHIFLLTDKVIPEEKVAEVIKEFGFKEQGLELKETQMRFDSTQGKLYTKDTDGKEINFENLANSPEDNKIKHRFVRKVMSCQECAAETKKTEAFLYAHDNEFSQVKVDSEGNTLIETVILPAIISDSDRQHMLLQFGYVGKKTPAGFSYIDEPISKFDLKNAIQKELNLINGRYKNKLLHFQVFPVMGRFDFLRVGLNTDRIITNNPSFNPPLYFHDIAINKRKSGEKSSDRADAALSALIFLNQGSATDRKVEIMKIGKRSRDKLFDKEEAGGPNKAPSSGGAGEAMTVAYFEAQKHTRKSRRQQNSGNGNNNESGPTPTTDFYIFEEKKEKITPIKINKKEEEGQVGSKTPTPTMNVYADKQEDNLTGNHKKQKNGEATPENPAPQIPPKIYLEEEISELFPARTSTTISSPLLEINQIEPVEHIEIEKEVQVKAPTEKSKKRVKPPEKKKDVEIVERTVIKTEIVQENKEIPKKILARQINIPNISGLIFPIIRNPFPIGERVDMEKIQMEEIWEMFLRLYFAVITKTEFEIRQEKKKKMFIVAEQEVKTGTNFFQSQQFGNYIRIFAILFICILRYSRGI